MSILSVPHGYALIRAWTIARPSLAFGIFCNEPALGRQLAANYFSE
ncbi:MAG: hypothetical protein ABIP78_06890 [Pyrinomonadaceae bacterium]